MQREGKTGEPRGVCGVSSVTQGAMFSGACLEGETDIPALPKCVNVFSPTTNPVAALAAEPYPKHN